MHKSPPFSRSLFTRKKSPGHSVNNAFAGHHLPPNPNQAPYASIYSQLMPHLAQHNGTSNKTSPYAPQQYDKASAPKPASNADRYDSRGGGFRIFDLCRFRQRRDARHGEIGLQPLASHRRFLLLVMISCLLAVFLLLLFTLLPPVNMLQTQVYLMKACSADCAENALYIGVWGTCARQNASKLLCFGGGPGGSWTPLLTILYFKELVDALPSTELVPGTLLLVCLILIIIAVGLLVWAMYAISLFRVREGWQEDLVNLGKLYDKSVHLGVRTAQLVVIILVILVIATVWLQVDVSRSVSVFNALIRYNGGNGFQIAKPGTATYQLWSACGILCIFLLLALLYVSAENEMAQHKRAPHQTAMSQPVTSFAAVPTPQRSQHIPYKWPNQQQQQQHKGKGRDKSPSSDGHRSVAPEDSISNVPPPSSTATQTSEGASGHSQPKDVRARPGPSKHAFVVPSDDNDHIESQHPSVGVARGGDSFQSSRRTSDQTAPSHRPAYTNPYLHAGDTGQIPTTGGADSSARPQGPREPSRSGRVPPPDHAPPPIPRTHFRQPSVVVQKPSSETTGRSSHHVKSDTSPRERPFADTIPAHDTNTFTPAASRFMYRPQKARVKPPRPGLPAEFLRPQ